MTENNHYIYSHIKPSGEVFYIGIGKNDRALQTVQRSKFWKDVFKKHGREVQILKRNLSREDACELEKILISYYGRRDVGTGTLVNMTDGGDGNLNPSDEWRLNHSEKMSGENNPMFGRVWTEEERKRHSEQTYERNKGKESPLKGKPRPSYVHEALREGKNKWVPTEEYLENLSKRMKLQTGEKNSRSKKVINIETQQIFVSLKEAALFNNIPISTLQGMLCGRSFNKSPFRILDEYRTNTCKEKEYKKGNKIIDIKTKVIYNFVKNAASQLNIPLSTLSSYLSGRVANKTSMIYLKDYIEYLHGELSPENKKIYEKELAKTLAKKTAKQ